VTADGVTADRATAGRATAGTGRPGRSLVPGVGDDSPTMVDGLCPGGPTEDPS